MFKNLRNGLILASATMSGVTYASSIDWDGVFGVNTTVISDWRRTDTNGNHQANGGQTLAEPSGSPDNAKFQSYVFKLRPSIIVNDSSSFFAEFTSGYGNGGFLGDSSVADKQNTSKANALYNYSTVTSNELTVTKLYGELYADTATYVLGRFPINWGLGAVFNDGSDQWSRHASIEDGVMAKFVIGNFHIYPYWTKINSAGSLSNQSDFTAFGAQLLYDNTERDMSFGLMLSKRKTRENNTTATANTEGTQTTLGATNVKIVDLYFNKGFGRFNFALEVPIIEGDLGNVFNSQSGVSSYKTNAIISEMKYDLNDKWNLFFNIGQVRGQDGGTGSFKALYLHPNYQIANLMFRYNLDAVADTTQSVYDSHLTNLQYLKLAASYTTNKWTWNAGLIYAQAIEVAESGKDFFKHETNTRHTSAVTKQDKDYGYEIDLGFDYAWNSNVKIEGDIGYHFVGDYYKFTNSTTEQKVKDTFAATLQAAIQF